MRYITFMQDLETPGFDPGWFALEQLRAYIVKELTTAEENMRDTLKHATAQVFFNKKK